MYINEQLYTNILGYENEVLDFKVSCAGRAIVDDVNAFVERYNGLSDYQLLYISEGCGYFKFNENDDFKKIEGKTAILFKPHEPQIYKYYTTDKPHTYWIHFTGKDIKNLLEELNLTNKKVIKIKNDMNFKDYFKKIIYEFQNKADAYTYASDNYAKLALIELNRESKNLSKSSSDIAIEKLCQKMHMNYYQNISNAEYAERCNMSVSHFLAKFKSITKMSPQNYILNLRIEGAKKLLATTNYKIGEVSKLVGFDDSMYFCKRFRKIVGISPSSYRKSAHFNGQQPQN